MITVKFNLRHPKASKPTPIVALIRISGWEANRPLKFSTERAIHPDDWRFKDEEGNSVNWPKDPRNKHRDLSQHLTKIEELAREESAKYYRKHEKYPTPSVLKTAMDVKLQRRPAPREVPTDFHGFMRYHIDRTGKMINPETNKNYARETLAKYRQLEIVMDSFFQSRYRGHWLDFDQIDQDMYIELMDYLTHEVKLRTGQIGYRPNGASNHIKKLIAVLNAAAAKGYILKDQFKDYRVIEETPNTIYTDYDTIRAFMRFEMPNTRLDHVRDNYIARTFTGQRDGSYRRLGEENFIEGDQHSPHGYLSLPRTNKTESPVLIPIFDELKAIRDKWKGITKNSLPPPIALANFNEYIKDAFELLPEMQEDVPYIYVHGGKTHVETRPKYSLVGSHTARRSFATIMYEANVNEEFIMAVTGHKHRESFLRYIRLEPKQKAQVLLSNFNKYRDQQQQLRIA